MTDATDALITQRRTTHGDWATQAVTEQALKAVMQAAPNWPHLAPHQRSALEMLAVKQARILCGNPDEPDHWADIAGYARLGQRGHDGPPSAPPRPPGVAGVRSDGAGIIADWPGHT